MLFLSRKIMKVFLVLFALVICLPLSQSKNVSSENVNCTRWEKGVLNKRLKRLCILRSPEIRLITVNGSMLRALRKNKLLTLYHPQAQRLPYGVPNLSRREKRQVQLFHLCQESLGSIFVLVDDNENLVYEIETVKCEDGCYIGSRRIRIGDCVTKKKTIELLVSDGCNRLKPKVIEVGCNCECMKYLMFL